MSTGSLALKHRDRLLGYVHSSLEEAGVTLPTELVEGVFRAFVRKLDGEPIDDLDVERVRALRLPEGVVTRAAEAVAESLRIALPDVAGQDGAGRVLETERALRLVLDDLLDLPESGIADLLTEEGESVDDEPTALEPRSSLVTALQEFAETEQTGLPVADGPKTQRPRALLRVRASTEDAATQLAAGVAAAIAPLDVERLPAAPDELLLASAAADDDAPLALVRAAATLAQLVGTEHGEEVAYALVRVAADGDVEAALRAATVRTQKMWEPGLVELDGPSFEAASDVLAEVPTHPRCVDPVGPFKNDRWEQSAFLQRPPLIGRDLQVLELGALLEERGPGEAPRLVVLHGPAGIGKTTLLRAALEERGLGDRKAPILWGAADPSDPTPLAALVGMVRSLAGAPAGHPEARERLAALLSVLAGGLHDAARQELLSLEPVLAYLIGAGDSLGDLERVESWGARVLQVAVRRAALLLLEGMIARGEGRPGVVVLTGATDMDAPTQSLLEFLARRLRGRVLFVLVSTQRLRLTKSFEEHFDVQRFEVPPLDGDDARIVIASLLGTDAEQLRSLRPIVTKARGSPLALAHVVRFAIEGGFLVRHEDGWDPAGLKARQVPGRVEQLLEKRVRRLPDDARLLLGACAMIGLTCTPAALADVGRRLELSDELTRGAISLLLSTGFLVHSVRKPAVPLPQAVGDEMYSFDHPLLRPAAEGALGEKEAKRLHGFVAEALSEVLGDGTRAVAASLARHYRRGGNPAAAREHYLAALRRAVRLDDRVGAHAIAEIGLKLADDEESRFAFELELEKVLENEGDRSAQARALKQLVRSAEATGDPRMQGKALHRVARFNVFSGDADKAEEAAGHALDFYRFDGDPRGQAQCLRVIALARFERRDFEGAVDSLEAARALTDDDDARVVSVIEHQLGLMRLEAGDVPGALEHLLEARAQKLIVADLAGEGAILDALADVFVRAQRPHVALELADRAVALRDRIGDEPGRAQSTRHLAEIALLLGDPDNAANHATEARNLARNLSLGRLEREATLVAARAALQQGDTETAEPLIDGVRRRTDRDTDPYASMEAAVLSARAKWMRAQSAEGAARDRLLQTALRRAAEATELGETHGYASGQVLGTAIAGAVYAEQGDASNALMHAQRASELIEDRAGTRIPLEEVIAPHAQALLAIGDDDEARAALSRAVEELEASARRLPRRMRERFWAVPARAELKETLARLEG